MKAAILNGHLYFRKSGYQNGLKYVERIKMGKLQGHKVIACIVKRDISTLHHRILTLDIPVLGNPDGDIFGVYYLTDDQQVYLNIYGKESMVNGGIDFQKTRSSAKIPKI